MGLAYPGAQAAGASPLALYLLLVNLVTFLVAAARHRAVTGGGRGASRRDADVAPAGGVALVLLPLAGGAVGALVALALWDRHVNKHDVAWWLAAVLGLVAWWMVCAASWGWVALDPDPRGLLTGWDPVRLRALGAYLLVANGCALVAFCADKGLARRGAARVPESVLLGLCLAGGSVGGMLGMRLARHKTRKWYFSWGPPATCALQLALLAFAHQAGAL